MAQSRNPPNVKKLLRQEVGFGCPVPGCGDPYLTYHHFDPEWHIEQHNDPARMIALCREHHDKAGTGTFSVEELRDMKRTALARAEPVKGRFDWMKRDVIAVAGGNFSYEDGYAIVLGGEPLLWFNRDDEHRQLLNIRMPSGPDGEDRTALIDNDWVLEGNPVDVISKPGGAELDIRYANGDRLYIRFRSIPDAASLAERYFDARAQEWIEQERWPITAVEVNLKLSAHGLEWTPRGLIGGHMMMTNCVTRHNAVGIQLG